MAAAYAKNAEQTLRCEVDFPGLIVGPTRSSTDASSNSEADPRKLLAKTGTSTVSSPSNQPSEHELSTSTLVDDQRAEATVPVGKLARGRRDSVTSLGITEELRACSPLTIRPDADLRIEDAQGKQTVYPVYSCHHVTGMNYVILDPTVLNQLQSILMSKDEKVRASRLRSSALETTLSKTQREKDTAITAKDRAQNAEARASSALDIARQEKANALLENRLLQQALQLAQRGYHDTKEEAVMLRKELERAHENNDRLQQSVEALHDILSANKVEMINLRKDHEFARRQSKAYWNAMQRSVEGREAARLQLIEQMCEERRVAAERVAEVERRNVDLEELLAVKMRATGQISNGDCCIDVTHADILDADKPSEKVEEQRNGWVGSWRGRCSSSVDALEDARRTQSGTISLNVPVDMTQPSMRQSNWGVKSLRLPGVWEGDQKEPCF